MGENALAVAVIVGLMAITIIPFVMVVIDNYVEPETSPMQRPPNMAAAWHMGDSGMNQMPEGGQAVHVGGLGK